MYGCMGVRDAAWRNGRERPPRAVAPSKPAVARRTLERLSTSGLTHSALVMPMEERPTSTTRALRLEYTLASTSPKRRNSSPRKPPPWPRPSSSSIRRHQGASSWFALCAKEVAPRLCRVAIRWMRLAVDTLPSTGCRLCAAIRARLQSDIQQTAEQACTDDGVA